ncbi:hypothetical protein K08M3_14240 [Vibrio alginolyticus]|uniref:Uncharacterized protein n=1 Tax=Vibrio alginolyticus TaxID=663 RepID=A0A1W6UJX4_VIBAL|nr:MULTISPECIES: hypothetical protein [Vibrio]ARO98364.1 hypothetical protein K01M1_14210 [Vibrio alginolyticus]ARP03081.1 hypothetical protein K04M1_14330 [Vibrio alginolyticus]ARP08139.1 hypothetical protein K04M3_14360 [Vibrio alginolyticus]ARP13201.1 hypothetical protein K04M5_14010 [Vibrio alginolyticus]ARP18261.1 hypothetical protein K05K4_14250 [Vibrio alginolyticus]
MTEQLNEVEENKEVESKDKDQQLKDLLQENENALKAQRERDEKIAKLKLSIKEDALDEFEKTYHNLNITPQDLAKRFGFKIAEEKEKVEPEKTKSKRKTQEHISFLYIKDGVQYERKSSSPRTFLVEPWKSLLFDGNINDHCTLWYADVPEEEIKVSGKYDEAVKTVKVTRKYFTQAMINDGEKLPEKKIDIERIDNKVIQDVEALKASVRSMM